MSNVFTDLRYASQLSSRLVNFTQKKAELYQFSHSCEDFTKSKVKKRAFIFRKGDGVFVYCHHCNLSQKFSTFLRDLDPSLYEDYRLEAYKTVDAPKFKKEEVKNEPEPLPLDDVLSGLRAFSDIPESHPAKKKLRTRRIPEHMMSKLFLANKYFSYISKFDSRFAGRNDEHPRMIIPYFDVHGRVFFMTARAFGDEQPKYINTSITNEEPIYGLERIDPSKKIIVVEGQIDSMFLPNAIAVGGASYDSKFLGAIKSNCVIVPDNDFRRNIHVFKQVKKVIERGFDVALLPEDYPKDINECIRAGITSESLEQYIRTHTMNGNEALLELAVNRKC